METATTLIAALPAKVRVVFLCFLEFIIIINDYRGRRLRQSVADGWFFFLFFLIFIIIRMYRSSRHERGSSLKQVI